MRLFGYNLTARRYKNAGEPTSLENPAGWLVQQLIGMAAASGVRVTPLTALGVPTVLACVNQVSRSIASMPFKLYQKTEKTIRLATEHPLYDLLTTAPVPGEVTASSFKRSMQANATLRNISYALIVKNGLNEVAELVPISPADMNVHRNQTSFKLEYRLLGKLIDPKYIFALPGLTFDGYVAADPMGYARDAIGLTIALQDNASKFFANGCKPGGILSHPMTLSKEAQDRLKEEFESQTKGDMAYSLKVLEEGMSYVNGRMDNTSSQMDETRKYQDHAIARVFGVQISKLGMLENAHYNNIEHENLSYVSDCLLPWGVQWEETANMKLLSIEERAKGYFFKFNFGSLLRGDLMTRYQAYALARNWGWMNVDEIRELEEMNPLPDGEGQEYLKPLNMIDIGSDPQDVQPTPDAGENGKPGDKPKKPAQKKKIPKALLQRLLNRMP